MHSKDVFADDNTPIVEHICDTEKYENSPSKNNDANGNGACEQDQSINEALKVIELSLNKLHQSLMIIKSKNVDPAATAMIAQQARELQHLVTANSSASTISSITTLSGGCSNHGFMYEPWDTGDPYNTVMPTPPSHKDEPTVVSLESKGITHYENQNPSGNDSDYCQASLPDFNDMPFVPTDEGPPDPQSHLLEASNFIEMHWLPKAKVPPDPPLHARESLDQVPPDPKLLECNQTHVDPSMDCKPPDPLQYSKGVSEPNELHFDPADWEPPDPSKRKPPDPSNWEPPDPSNHSVNFKHHTPGLGEQQEQKRKKMRKDLATITTKSQTVDPYSRSSSSFCRNTISNFLQENLFKYL